MILLQLAATIAIAVVISMVVFEYLANRRDRQILDHELTEAEVQQHVHPDGNVHVLTPNKETAESD